MPIAVTEDHESLRAAALRWAQTHCPASVPREAAEVPPGAAAELPAAWEKMAAQGWLGLHVSEEQGGQGFSLAELAIVLEELGHALFPGPVLPTVLVSAALARGVQGPAAAPPEWLRGLADGSITAAVALGAAPLPRRGVGDGAVALDGTVRPVLGLPTARLVLIPLDDGTGRPGATPCRWRRCRRWTPPAAWGSSPSPARAGSRCRRATRCCCPTTTCAAWP
jgi:alkylation response protein AidB-like acyl-CoA dehydrogenase